MAELEGKVALVTGATGGLGKVAAGALVAQGAEVVIVGRDPTKVQATVAELLTRAPGAKVSALLGDLARPVEVQRVAREFRQGHGRLDILLNNAGALFHERQVTSDGLDFALAAHGVADSGLHGRLMDLYLRLDAYPEVHETLTRLSGARVS